MENAQLLPGRMEGMDFSSSLASRMDLNSCLKSQTISMVAQSEAMEVKWEQAQASSLQRERAQATLGFLWLAN